nr:serine/arginine repetitive matrix protein 2-like [Ipomoea batatas]
MLAFNNFFGINSSYQHSCGGIYKKPSNSTIQRSRNESSSPPEQKFSTWKSLSLSDLQEILKLL